MKHKQECSWLLTTALVLATFILAVLALYFREPN